MAVQLNHTIVHATDPAASAAFMSALFGLPVPSRFGHFHVVNVDNGVSLDFMEAGDAPFDRQHYAFLVSETEFDEIFARINEQGLDIWADPMQNEPGVINTHYGGRGVYFKDPDGHLLEIITTPYGTEP
jgi:catechol 2,3-dioxygenase-like lactoylglutathione lyase family enzyme